MKKLVAYLTTAFPDKNFTIDAILALKEAGAYVCNTPAEIGEVTERALRERGLI
jgi:tryptophan synthase alpha subunit